MVMVSIQYNGNDIQYHLMGDPFYIKPRWVRNFHAWWDDHHLLKLLVTSGDHCIKTHFCGKSLVVMGETNG